MQKKIQIGEIVERSKRLETMLKSLEAEGRGMHELISSVQEKLDSELNRKLRYIATIRNNAIHDVEFDIADNIAGFHAACDEAEAELKRMIRPKRKRSPKTQTSPVPKFNYLYLLPFIPGLNIIYFFFLLVLSILRISKYVIMLVLYVLAFHEIIQGIIRQNTVGIIVGSVVFAVLYVCGMFIPLKTFSKLRYIPVLSMAGVIVEIKNRVHWSLFITANIFIIMTIFSILALFSWQRYLIGALLFTLAYVGGAALFLAAGKSSREREYVRTHR